MAQEIFQVDAFTNKSFAGNPAAVCILPEAADETWMPDVANEMNLSETAFLVQIDYLLEFESAKTVREITPDFTLLSAISARGFMVTSKSDSSQYDFISRFFAPAFGVNEDPVTGSAHCCLGPYWAKKLGKEELTAFQASARGGLVKVRVGDDRVFLGGKAVTVMRAILL